jgi:hypothetical protein
MSNSAKHDSFDPSRRRLCPDGACIGVIGEDGRCKECGKAERGGSGTRVGAAAPDQPGEAAQGEATQAEAAQGEAAQGDAAQEQDTQAASLSDEAEAAGEFDPRRRLCPDGACVGVLGPDGRCSVCGAKTDGTSPASDFDNYFK